jgi:hypothetical protein
MIGSQGSRDRCRSTANLLEDKIERDGPWDLVIMRDVLHHVTFKRRFPRCPRQIEKGTELALPAWCRRDCGQRVA